MVPLEYTLTIMWPRGSSTKPGGWRYRGSSLTKAPVAAAVARGIGAVADGNPQPVPGDQVQGGGFVIHRQRGH
jgi:hypothetical protein